MSNKKTTAAPEAGAAVKLNQAAVFLASLGIIADAESDLTIGEAETSLVALLNEYSASLETTIVDLKNQLNYKNKALEDATEVLYAFDASDGERYQFTIPDFRFKGQLHQTEDVLKDAELLDQVFEAKPFFIKKL